MTPQLTLTSSLIIMAPHTRARTDLGGTTNPQPLLNVAAPSAVPPFMPQATPSVPAPPAPNTPYAYYPTSSAVSITACRISKADLDKIELLDRAKNNWTS
ncbi:uncharacterized protein F5147DRAFT_664837 [Suillus discolor]|uniref:Uncharacterized protein n=1 Tax=Suillus discolor TaxID=1912936 RepID=A0A9P7FKZ7_9AGAM|nr:uncharacterized protein F5147DRAFT_664837 [Suillus discolor]KAG2119611.1 hypothetical protein F5147DRAFT_664837 [Suillus discolor]